MSNQSGEEVSAERLVDITLRQVGLRNIELADLPTLYEFQLDPDACQMAAVKPRMKEVFDAHWDQTLQDKSTVAKAILLDNALCGCISCFESEGQSAVGYWLGKSYWGSGIATRALSLFLADVLIRPLHASVAVTNVASLHVLQNCGFQIVGQRASSETDRYFACEETLLEFAGN